MSCVIQDEQRKKQATLFRMVEEYNTADLGIGLAAVKSFWNSFSKADRQKLLTVKISDLADRAKQETKEQEERLELGKSPKIADLNLYFSHCLDTQHQCRVECCFQIDFFVHFKKSMWTSDVLRIVILACIAVAEKI